MASRVTGANAKVAIKPQTAFGTLATGNWLYVPFMSLDLGPNDQVSDDAVLGLGREAQRPARDTVEIRGQIVVPVDVINIGWWLLALFGPCTTTGASAPYTHVFTSDRSDLKLLSLEVQHPDGASNIFTTYRDVAADGFSIDFAPTGRPRLTIDLLASNETEDGTSAAGTPTTAALTWFHQKVNYLRKDTVDVAKIPSYSLSFTNNYEADRYIGGNGEIGDLVPGQSRVTGTLEARFNDTVLRDLAVAGTVFDLLAGFSNSADEFLQLEIDQAELVRRGRSIAGPGGIAQRFEVLGSKDAGEGTMFRARLKNATAAYT